MNVKFRKLQTEKADSHILEKIQKLAKLCLTNWQSSCVKNRSLVLADLYENEESLVKDFVAERDTKTKGKMFKI